MSVQRFLSGSRDQAFLLPPDMREWLADDHLVWAVIEAVEQLDLNLLRRAYRDDGNGRPAYDPALLVALLLYGYATGDRSSRVIERRCREDVACRVIMAGLAPDHATIARFRRRHAQALIGLFSQVLALCRAAGLGRLGTIAIDGTKIHANASKERYAMREQAAALIDDAEAVDDLEDNLDRSGQAALKGSNGVGNAAECRARFDAAAKQLSSSEADAPAPAPAKLDPKSNQARGRRLATSRRGARNLTDPESRVMRSRSGWIQGYNAQVAVSDDHLVIACEITSRVNDHAQLEPMIQATRKRLADHDQPVAFLADSGYWSGEAVQRLIARGERLLVPPNGRPRTRGVGGSSTVTDMTDRLAEPENQARYRRRQALVEPVIAHIKCNRRLDRFLLRGEAGARLEWSLGCTAHNLKRLAR